MSATPEQLQSELVRTREQLALTVEAGNVVLSRLPLQEQLQRLVDLTCDRLGHDACILRLLKEGLLEHAASKGVPPGVLFEVLPASFGISREIIQERRPLSIEDSRTHPVTRGLRERLPHGYEFRSYAGAPMLVEDRVMGILGVYSEKTPRTFSETDLEYLQILANHAAVAVENDRLLGETLAEHEKLLIAEESVLQANLVYRDLIPALKGAPYRRGLDEDRYDFVGPGIVVLTGFEAGELTHQLFLSRVRDMIVLEAPPDLSPDEVEELYHRGELHRWRADYLFEKKDGTQAWITDIAVAWKDASGRVLGMIGMLLDINQRKQAEAALRERETHLRTILDALPDCVLVSDADGVVIEVNPAGLKMFGLGSSVGICGEFISDFVVLVDRERYQEFHEQVTAGGGSFGKFQMMTKSGETRQVESHTVPLRDSQGNVQMLLSVIRDVTEQRELESMLRQSQKMDAVGRLAGGVAHDFNNILTGIMSLVEVGSMSATGELADDLEELQRLCLRGADLTRQLLSFSRRAPAKNVVVNVNDVIREARKLIGRLIGEHIEIETVLDPTLLPVLGDPALLEQVIVNMAVNARDAMPDGGHLTIVTRQVDFQMEPRRTVVGTVGQNFVAITVCDTGLGMSAEVLERTFEPFFTTKQEGKGTGLGMSTAYGIVKQLGGDISATSQPGQGSTFEILLPTMPAESNTEAGKPEMKSADPVTGAGTILVAEDDEAVRRLTARVLRSRGYTVLEASDGVAALRISDQHSEQIDLLVSDMVMPRMGGKELAEKILQRRPGISILYVSGYTTDKSLLRLGRGSSRAFIQKPFSPVVLVDKVSELLSQ